MPVQPRKALAGIRRSVHGGPDYAECRELNIAPDEILDFSVNACPGNPPAGLWKALKATALNRYPDSEAHEMRSAAASRFGLSIDDIAVGNGSVDLIWSIALAYLEPGDVTLVVRPTFAEYEAAASIQGARLESCWAFPQTWSEDELSTRLARLRPRVAFICNPNNPTGHFYEPSSITALACRHQNTLVVVDEAYADFVAGSPSVISADMPANLMVLRSMTKFPALAGLRLGLAVGRPRAIENIRKVQPPWNVNAMAQAAGLHLLRQPTLLPEVHVLAEAKELLFQGFTARGLAPLPSACNFFLLPVASLVRDRRKGRTPGAAVRQALLRQRCLVRDCTSFGLPDYVRVSLRTPAECRRLLDAFDTSLLQGQLNAESMTL